MSGSLSTSALAALIAECEDEASAMAVMAGLIAETGATCAVLYSFNYGVKSATERWTPLFSTFPAEISAFYRENRCLTDDPYIRAALLSPQPVRFQDAEAGFEPSDVILRMYELMRAHGLRDGLAMHLSDRPGRLTYLCLAYDRDLEDISEFERRLIQTRFEMFMHHAGDILGLEGPRDLSPKENEVVTLLARGKSNKEIARSLGLSPSTVNTMINRCFDKLGVTTRTEAVIAACRAGFPMVA